MNTQMNTTDAEIVDRLDGMEVGCVRLKNNPGMSNGMWLTITDIETREKTTRLFFPSDLITLCRAVVERTGTLKDVLDELTDEERCSLFSNYCRACGSKDSYCQCWNDE